MPALEISQLLSFFRQDFVIEACGVNKQQPPPKVTLMTGEKKRTRRTFWTAYSCYSANTPVRKREVFCAFFSL